MRIGFATLDWSMTTLNEITGQGPAFGGSGWYRVGMVAEALARQGHDVVVGGLIASNTTGQLGVQIPEEVKWTWPPPEVPGRRPIPEWTGPHEWGFDVVVMQRWMMEDLPDRVWRARALGQAVVNDIDDWFWGLDPRNQAWKGSHPKLHPHSNTDHYRKTLAASSLVTVSTPYLAERLHKMMPDTPIVVVRNAFDLARWPTEPPPERPVTVGWVGGVPWRSGDLETLRGVLGPFLADHPEVECFHGGHLDRATSFAELVGVPPERVRIADMAPTFARHELFRQVDIGLAPLTSQPFNRSKCIDFDTRVPTSRGVLPAGNVREGDKVWADGWKTVEAIEHSAPRAGLRITTQRGWQITVTPEHRLMVDATWVEANHIVAGDSLALQPGAFGSHEMLRVPFPASSKVSREKEDAVAFMDAPDSPTILLNERWARLFGLFLGDGCAGSGPSTAVHISVDGQDQDLLDLILEDWRAIGLTPTCAPRRKFDGTILRRQEVRAPSVLVMRLLYGVGLATADTMGNVTRAKRRRVLRVPEAIWCSPEPVVAAFLSGLFEADGHLTDTGVVFTTKEWDLAQDVLGLLACFGISAQIARHRVARYPDNDYWKVRLGRHDADIFAERIGFLSVRKQKRLAEIVSKPHSNAYKLPPTHDPVVSIEAVTVVPVDLQVEGERFCAAGILSHNSACKLYEYAAAGAASIASDIDEYRWASDRGMGRVARKPKQWRSYLELLLDPEVRQAEAKAARVLLEEMDVDKRYPDWLATYAYATENP